MGLRVCLGSIQIYQSQWVMVVSVSLGSSSNIVQIYIYKYVIYLASLKRLFVPYRTWGVGGKYDALHLRFGSSSGSVAPGPDRPGRPTSDRSTVLQAGAE